VLPSAFFVSFWGGGVVTVDISLSRLSYFFYSDTTSTSHTVFFDDKDNQVLTRLCQCFKLHGSLFQPAYGRHRGVLR
jgi:hypothetical protein